MSDLSVAAYASLDFVNAISLILSTKVPLIETSKNIEISKKSYNRAIIDFSTGILAIGVVFDMNLRFLILYIFIWRHNLQLSSIFRS